MDSNEVLDILFYGWYGKNNLGDDLFEYSFRQLYSCLKIDFTSELKDLKTRKYRLLIVGGGNVISDNLGVILNEIDRPYEVWSVSFCEKDINSIKKARRILVRDTMTLDISKNHEIKDKVVYAPDIVFLNYDRILPPKNRGDLISILPNIYFVPSYKDPITKWIEYLRFTCETARFIEESEEKFEFVSMQKDGNLDDHVMSYAICGSTIKKRPKISNNDWKTFDLINYKAIISTKYHGAILAIMTNTPLVCINAHSKMSGIIKDMNLTEINYYEFSKDCLHKKLKEELSCCDSGKYCSIMREIKTKVGVYSEFSREIIKELS
jgi:hypothetical protein